MSLLSTFRVALAVGALALPATAQIQAYGGNAERMAATRLFFTPDFSSFKGMICIQYGAPAWKAEYDTMLPTLKGKNLRLGKDYWTTFNTSVALDFAGTKVEAGSYYLGLKCDAEGNFSLLVLKAEAADKAGVGPFTADAWKPDYTIAMKKSATEKSADKMLISIDPDPKDATTLTFKIEWGKHQLAATAKATLTSST